MLHYQEYKSTLDKNLEFLTKDISRDKGWHPSWEWYQFPEGFNKVTKIMWMGYLTYQKLKILIEFNKVKGLKKSFLVFLFICLFIVTHFIVPLSLIL